MVQTDAQNWLLWDGECDFCAWSVARVRARDRNQQFRVVPFQSAPPELLQKVNPHQLLRGVHVISREGRVFRAGRAVLFIMEQLGNRWLARILSLPPLIWGVELGYWLIARNRKRISRWLRLSDQECPR
ncbi:MAG: DUF393 domain-containing protein [Fimbriimonadales bacterium]